MPRIPIHLASGSGLVNKFRQKSIRLVRYGCTNRPFYHIVVIDAASSSKKPPIEQLGSYDECQNMFNEKLLSLNYERVQYWIGQGAFISPKLLELLGITGLLPIHPKTYITSWRQRQLQ